MATRARKKGITDTVEVRIAHICNLMRTLKFRRGRTVKQLAKDWELGEQRVRELTAEASKRVRAEVMNPDIVNAHVGVALMTALDDELAKKSKKNGRVIADLARTWAQISGAQAPQEIKVTAANAPTPAAARRAMEEAFGPLLGEKANAGDVEARDVPSVSSAT